MSRPTKQGIEFFSIDCQFDDKIELFLLEKESTGLAVLVTLWQLIYHNEGYYIINDKNLHLLIKKRINVDINEVNECINVCLCRGIFDELLYKKHKILTSKAIQKRYFMAARRKKNVRFDVKYIINGVNVCENAVNVLPQATQEKEKEKEEVKEKEKEDKGVPDWLPEKAWHDYIDMRKNIKSPMTDRAKELAIKKLEIFKDQGHDVVEIINNSIMNSWKGLFLTDEQRGKDGKTAKGSNEKAAKFTGLDEKNYHDEAF